MGDDQNSLVFGVGFMRYLYLFYQNSHWQCAGNNFYSAHQLFERLYTEVSKDADQLAERAIGIFDKSVLNFKEQFEIFNKLNSKYASDNEDYFIAFVKKGMTLEIEFQKFLEACKFSLQEAGKLSMGLDDLIMSHASRGEDRIYLLKQSLSNI